MITQWNGLVPYLEEKKKKKIHGNLGGDFYCRKVVKVGNPRLSQVIELYVFLQKALKCATNFRVSILFENLQETCWKINFLQFVVP